MRTRPGRGGESDEPRGPVLAAAAQGSNCGRHGRPTLQCRGDPPASPAPTATKVGDHADRATGNAPAFTPPSGGGLRQCLRRQRARRVHFRRLRTRGVILTVAPRGGLEPSDVASWLFGGFLMNGLISIAFSWLYREPLVLLWSIPGTVLVGPALTHLAFPEVIGAFLATGVLMLALGLSGWVRRCMEAGPIPVVMGMVSGFFLRFALDLVYAMRDQFWIAAPMVLVFFAVGAVPFLAPRLPPLVA